MFCCLYQSHPLFGVLHQDLPDEISDPLADVLRVGDFGLQNLLVCFVLAASFVLERGMACDKLVREDADGPDIDHKIIGFPDHYLWRHVVQGPAEGLSVLFGGVYAPAEIREFQDPVPVENILGFDIAMEDVEVVETSQGFEDLFQVPG